MRVTAKNRAKLKKLFIWTTKPSGTEHHKHKNYTWLFISNCNNVSDILDWTWFLHYFWLQEFIQQQTENLMNKQKLYLNQQIHNLHMKNPLRENVKHLFACVPFSLGSICKTLHLGCLTGFWMRPWITHRDMTDRKTKCFIVLLTIRNQSQIKAIPHTAFKIFINNNSRYQTQKVPWWVLWVGDVKNIHKSSFTKNHY